MKKKQRARVRILEDTRSRTGTGVPDIILAPDSARVPDSACVPDGICVPDGTRARKRLPIRTCAAALCLTLALSGCGGSKNASGAEDDAALQEAAGTAVQVSAVTRADIATDNKVSGSIAAEDEATVMVGVAAKCTKTYVEAGDVVTRGQVLCTLDLDSTLSQYAAAQISYDSAVQSREDQSYLLDRQLAMAQEQVAVAENQISVTRQQISVAEAQIPVAQAQVPMAQNQIATLEQQISNMAARLDQADKNVRDTEELFRQGAASQMELDNARMSAQELHTQADQLTSSLDQAKLAVDQAKLSVEQLNAQINQSKFSLTQLELQRDNARIQVEQLRATRTSTLAQLDAGIENAKSGLQQLASVLEDVDEQGNVTAPMGGTLVTFNALENSFISNAMPLAVIQQDGNMKLTASVSEALVPKLHTGDQADVYISSLDRHLTAWIRSVERSASQQTRLYTVTLTLPEGTAGLLSGMSADVTFHTDRVEGAVVVPSEAVLTNGPAEYVFIVEDGKARYVEITTGLTGTGVTEVLTGLRGGEALVTVGQSYLSDGDPVRIVSEN